MSKTFLVDASFNLVFFLLFVALAAIAGQPRPQPVGERETGLVAVYLPDGRERPYYIELYDSAIRRSRWFAQDGSKLAAAPTAAPTQKPKERHVRIVANLPESEFAVRVVPFNSDGEDTEAARRRIGRYVSEFEVEGQVAQAFRFSHEAASAVESAVFDPNSETTMPAALGLMSERAERMILALQGTAQKKPGPVVDVDPADAEHVRQVGVRIAAVPGRSRQPPWGGVMDEAALLERLNRIAGQETAQPTGLPQMAVEELRQKHLVQRMDHARHNALVYLAATRPAVAYKFEPDKFVWYLQDRHGPDDPPRVIPLGDREQVIQHVLEFDKLLTAAREVGEDRLGLFRLRYGRRYAETLLARARPKPVITVLDPRSGRRSPIRPISELDNGAFELRLSKLHKGGGRR